MSENQPVAGHSDLGYASDGDCESCSSQSLVRGGGSGESENSHSSGCCSPSSSAAAVETGITPQCGFVIIAAILLHLESTLCLFESKMPLNTNQPA